MFEEVKEEENQFDFQVKVGLTELVHNRAAKKKGLLFLGGTKSPN